MTKIICVNQSKFKKALGYGSWVIITGFLIFVLIANSIEQQNVYVPTDMPYSSYYDYTCYKSLLENREVCSSYLNMNDMLLNYSYWFIGMNIVNVTVIAFWIYNKQQKFKLSWCLNDKGE